MKPRHKRFALIGGIVGSVAVGLVLNAFQSNLVFFYSPSQAVAKEAPASRTFRLGGLVQEGSVKRDGTEVRFAPSPIPLRLSQCNTPASCPTCSRRAMA